MKFVIRALSVATLAAAATGAFAQKGETVKIAWIDPLSGLMGPVGNNQLKSFQYFAEVFSKTNPAGVKFEVIGIDNKLSPAESLNRSRPPWTRVCATSPRATARPWRVR